jgi:hypothetical protein
MPFRKASSLQDLEDGLWRSPGPELVASIRSVWNFSARVSPREFPPGVHRSRSIEEAQARRDEWEAADLHRYWARQRALGIPDPGLR